MAATVFYLDPLPDVGGIAVLDGDEGHHAATVRRIRVGERLTLSDGRGGIAETEVVAAQRDRLELAVHTRSEAQRPRPYVTLVQALPKSERSELAVELATEAGIDAIVPWQASRCVARWEGMKAGKGVAKWRATALSAARQSRRVFVPPVSELSNTAAVEKLIDDVVRRGGVAVLLHESAAAPFASLSLAVDDVVLVVGPEGGLDDRELDRFTAAGAVTALLGPTVLRTSTAAAVALGALGALTSRWDSAPPQ
ncbi:16S rRNA (uracil(1498)-N(3))-methyltransferase [Antrihabitans sp. YC3-6]|uniref:Ribosomal RNA small subunit methyltransferase E n=1 Tax=Antrihabitans stalagmiti TaxID=2799499 RepID=A0A934NVZ2_9NOCA|nr:16S rRNA (uracil(1498)-N(3))-methyltransferase [Antrihabitans stalagmiti]MBJ8342289.1 16S rRNA (uracil(1498)-N(3))-methyltransferase [Antrihabitans stalagmiti]